VIAKESIELYALLGVAPEDLRGVGIHMQKLEESNKEVKTKLITSFLHKSPVKSQMVSMIKEFLLEIHVSSVAHNVVSYRRNMDLQ
jgi:hypothetical protein